MRSLNHDALQLFTAAVPQDLRSFVLRACTASSMLLPGLPGADPAAKLLSDNYEGILNFLSDY